MCATTLRPDSSTELYPDSSKWKIVYLSSDSSIFRIEWLYSRRGRLGWGPIYNKDSVKLNKSYETSMESRVRPTPSQIIEAERIYPYLGLAHELGHAWDLENNGCENMDPDDPNTIWYTTADGKIVRQSDKIATWWENRIRAENDVALRESYSYIGTTPITADPSGLILIHGTRESSVIDVYGKLHPFIGPRLPNYNY